MIGKKFDKFEKLSDEIYSAKKGLEEDIIDIFKSNGWDEKEIFIELDETSFGVTLPFGNIDFKELIDINNIMKLEGFNIKAIADCQVREQEKGIVIFFSKIDSDT